MSGATVWASVLSVVVRVTAKVFHQMIMIHGSCGVPRGANELAMFFNSRIAAELGPIRWVFGSGQTLQLTRGNSQNGCN
jgi:hypothetical protein